MTAGTIAAYLGHGMAWLAVGWLLVVAYRWLLRQSKALAMVVAFGILVRVVLGLALFFISYLNLPIAEPLQRGNGFWRIALDATGYYEMAAEAAGTHGLISLDGDKPSPVFLNVLAVWMMAVGISPVAAMFLNLCLYMAIVVMVIRCFHPVNDWRNDLPCLVGVGAYTLSPVVLLHSTQPLKDELTSLFVTLGCIGVLMLARLVRGDGRLPQRAVLLGALAFAVAIFGMAGIRWYYALIMWGVLAMTLAAFAVRGRRAPFVPYAVGSVLVLSSGFLGFWIGAGPYAGLIPSYAVESPALLINMTQLARAGFLMSGGGTNVVVPLRETAAEGQARHEELVATQQASDTSAKQLAEQAAAAAAVPPPAPAPTPSPDEQAQATRAIPVNSVEEAVVVGTGLAIILAPLSLLAVTSGIEVGGGQGLLRVADVDTIFQDVVMLAVLALLWKRRHAIGDRRLLLVFGLLLSLTSAVMLGYVVTNFGTLWRMRTLVTMPVWLLVLAVSPRPEVIDSIGDAVRTG